MMTKRPTEDDLDDVRRMLLERARLRGVTLADLSRAAGKNLSYIHQFVWKGAPRALPLAVRVAVARALDLPEDMLRAAGEPSVASIIQAPEPAAPGPTMGSELHDVPLFRDDGVIDPALATEWTVGLRSMVSGGACVALWITTARGRLQPGDLAYVHMSQPPRVGDTVLALAGRQVAALGTLLSVDGGAALIRDAGDAPRELTLDDTKLAKVVAVRFA